MIENIEEKKPIHARTYAEIVQQNPRVPNDHPIRAFLSRQEIPTPTERRIDDLEELILHQLRPRTISLLFGGENDQETMSSMETVMGRLRRQYRTSVIRTQQAGGGQANIRGRDDARDRLEMDRMMRRIRQERRNESVLFHSAFYRWSQQPTEIQESNEPVRRLYSNNLFHER